MQARLERSVLGRAVISIALLITLAAITVANLPDSELRERLTPAAASFFDLTGLSQNWGVFSPNPRGISMWIDTRIDNADGTVSTWAAPGGAGMSAYRRYRWHKFSEYLRLDDQVGLWNQFARYVAAQTRADGHDPVRVTLTRRWTETLPPGPGPDHGPVQTFDYFITSRLGPAT